VARQAAASALVCAARPSSRPAPIKGEPHVLVCPISPSPSSSSNSKRHRCRRDPIEPRRPLSTPPELPLVQMEPRPAARSQSPYHVKSSGAQPVARSKSSPSICSRPEHTSGRTAAFYSCLMYARSSSSLLQVTNHTSQPS
jgi:hypothetical protein